MALGIVGTAPREYLDLRTALIDLDPAVAPAADASAVVAELLDASDRVVARRGLRRAVPATERVVVGPVDAATHDVPTRRHLPRHRRSRWRRVRGGRAPRPGARGQPRGRRLTAGADRRRARRVARPPRLRRPHQPPHPPPRRPRGDRHEGHRRDGRPRRRDVGEDGAGRGRAPGRPPRRRRARGRRAARQADRVDHPRGPRGRHRRQSARRADARRRAAATRRVASWC